MNTIRKGIFLAIEESHLAFTVHEARTHGLLELKVLFLYVFFIEGLDLAYKSTSVWGCMSELSNYC
jgi:hypothetical protein